MFYILIYTIDMIRTKLYGKIHSIPILFVAGVFLDLIFIYSGNCKKKSHTFNERVVSVYCFEFIRPIYLTSTQPLLLKYQREQRYV